MNNADNPTSALPQSKVGLKRIFRRFLQSIGVVFLFLLLTYGVLTYRFFTAKATISRNYTSELAARDTTTQDQRAYTIYRSFAIKHKLANTYSSFQELESVNNDTLPGETGWSDAQRFAKQFAPDLATVRRGASLPSLGGPFTDADDPIWFNQVTKIEDPSAIQAPGTSNPSLATVHMLESGWCRRIARSLQIDARVAVAEGDTTRCHQDLLGMLGVARQTGAAPFLFGRLVHISLVSLSTQEIRRILTESPDAFSEPQLTALYDALNDASRDTMQVNLDSELLWFEDWLQRSFTDDGNGNGRLTPEGFEDLESFGLTTEWTYPSSDSPYYRVTAPLVPVIMANRADLKSAFERLVLAAQQDAKQPLWNRQFAATKAEFKRLTSTRLQRARFLPVNAFFPSLDRAYMSCELGAMDRDATLAALALEIFRRRSGSYPQSLNELVPSLLPTLPIDIWNGNPLRYRLENNKPVLYSIGADRVDDNGPTPNVENTPAQTDLSNAEPKDSLFLPQIRVAPKVYPARAVPDRPGTSQPTLPNSGL